MVEIMKRPLKYQRIYSLIKKHRCAQSDVDSGGKYGNTEKWCETGHTVWAEMWRDVKDVILDGGQTPNDLL